ncbi:bifunctional tetrahydrofolate synthase/dihydrofolate synthase [Psychrobacter sp. AOP22-C1-22]|uniref:bifunctional tetrahydrofolate synthase/dihydrofolate synthase n=1 Tax=unclassified Psychrobacter TaxID=196806 RepID=UPI001787868B|nr:MULTISPECIES: bifunctional tetrahydrofolate synthase/dihydrofolate synthase [unclassified Psychrobacter]MDN5802637.1 bifunctional tetrahydrofolate synthase/dihydrofolate synthase [Psychrobacter sp.]MBE0406407.1 bifunctional tetrahydrofolate synthase/dihydrofolate synthase [Psychrobacter sp. FME6]MBE0443915.1 bifunctional tetrahydrofolate synthase/dihydrofolate synthase [Psychrobacter sp. FME5]MDN5891685.1 bifunctional tetrahydrofolate synthase/dihydrofolate synthase [Psychrobacter sp.]MDN58
MSDSLLANPNTPTEHSNLTEWLDYMQQIHVSAIDMGLSRVLPVAEALGVVKSAKDDAYVFTVAGTNGKGSTTAVIAQMCQAAGYKTALYQSPHLSVFNERVRINGEMVSDATLINAFNKVEAARLKCDLTLSFFEMTTLAALLIFAEADCDVWVLEVGLGGRLDVVNIIDPDTAVITNIAIDHVDWLGDNVEAIGAEKAGILRDDITVVYGATEMPSSVQQAIDSHQATCYQVGVDFSYREMNATTWQYSNAAVTMQLPRPALSLTNTANALSAVLASPLNVDTNAIEQALQTTKLAGRFDYREMHNRHWLFDVAHNEQGVEFLLAQLLPLWQQHLTKQNTTDAPNQNNNQANNKPASIKMLFSMLGDKDINKVVQRLTAAGLPISDWFIAEIDYPRAASTEQLQDILVTYVDGAQIHTFEHLPEATQAVIKASQPQDLIVVCGSFHTIGEALAALRM